jgi:hypothetical protein
MIIALVLMVVIGAQSCTVYLGGSVLEQQRTSEGGAVGILITLLFLVGGAFALPFPLVSLIAFLAAGLLGLAAGATTPFTDLTIWGVVALVLAVLSFLGLREKRRRRAESRSRVT